MLAYIDNAKRLRKIVSVITIFGFLYAFYAILQAVLSPERIYGIYEPRFATPFGSFVNRHNFAAFMEMSIAVPLGTHTDWNLYRVQPGELADRDGSFIAFARPKAEREAADDPRPSLEERYGSRAGYVAKVKAAADALVADRLLLPIDAEALVHAPESCDRF